MDHAGSLGHSGEAVLVAWSGGEGECGREELGEGVCRAYRTGGCEPGVVGGREVAMSGGYLVEDLGNGQSSLSISHTADE